MEEQPFTELMIESSLGECTNEGNDNRQDSSLDNHETLMEGYAHSAIGKYHIDHSMPCQDSSGMYLGSDYGVVAISDGHSDYHCFRSDVGSKIAVDVSISCIKSKLSQGAKSFFDILCDDECHELIEEILSEWKNCVQAYDNQNPASEEEWSRVREIMKKKVGDADDYEFQLELNSIIDNLFLRYGCTLRIGIISKEGYLAISIGDGGTLVLFPDGSSISPLPPDEETQGSETYSICDPDATSLFKFKYEMRPVLAISVNSDGIQHLCSESDEEYYQSEYLKKIILVMKNEMEWHNIVDRSVSNFAMEISKDDASLAFVSLVNFEQEALKTVVVPLTWYNHPSLISQDVGNRLLPNKRIKYGFVINSFDEKSYRGSEGIRLMEDLLKTFCESFITETRNMPKEDVTEYFTRNFKLLIQQWNRDVIEHNNKNPDSKEEATLRLTNHIEFSRESGKYGVSMAVCIVSGDVTYSTIVGKGKLIISGNSGVLEAHYDDPKSTAEMPFRDIKYITMKDVDRALMIGIDGTSKERILL